MRLHKEHGVNPTVEVCFWCGGEKGLALLGAGYKGKAPREMVLDYAPCPACQAMRTKGVTVIEAGTRPYTEHQPPIQEGLWPSGLWCVVQPQCIDKIITPEYRDKVLELGICFMDSDAMTATGIRAGIDARLQQGDINVNDEGSMDA